jgi:hypothetical protein
MNKEIDEFQVLLAKVLIIFIIPLLFFSIFSSISSENEHFNQIREELYQFEKNDFKAFKIIADKENNLTKDTVITDSLFIQELVEKIKQGKRFVNGGVNSRGRPTSYFRINAELVKKDDEIISLYFDDNHYTILFVITSLNEEKRYMDNAELKSLLSKIVQFPPN